MTGVLNIFEKHFERKGLRKFRFKVDPTIKQGFDKATTYEAYILSENFHGKAVIYIPLGSQMGMHDLSGVLPIPDNLEPIKNKIAEKLKGKPGEEYLNQIYTSNCFDEIQQYLKHIGMTDDDIIQLLKQVITNEGFNPFKAIAKGGEKLAQWKKKMDSYTDYLQTFDPNYLPTKPTNTPTTTGNPSSIQAQQYTNNPGLKSNDFKNNRRFIQWFDKKYKYNNDINKIYNILDNSSNNQLNYYAQKFLEQTGILIS